MTSFYTEKELKDIGFKAVGKECRISRKCSIYGAQNIIIGCHVRIDDFCILSGNIVLGSYIHIAPYSALFGGEFGIEMQDFSGLSSRSVVYAVTDDYYGSSLTNPTVPDEYRKVIGGKVTLEKHVIVGTGSTILPNLTIHCGTSVGSMSLVNKDLDEFGVYVGCPCRRIKDRKRDFLELEAKFKADYCVE